MSSRPEHRKVNASAVATGFLMMASGLAISASAYIAPLPSNTLIFIARTVAGIAGYVLLVYGINILRYSRYDLWFRNARSAAKYHFSSLSIGLYYLVMTASVVCLLIFAVSFAFGLAGLIVSLRNPVFIMGIAIIALLLIVLSRVNDVRKRVEAVEVALETQNAGTS